MVPGMYHCSGGPGADQFGGAGHRTWPGDPGRDVLWALIRWVEDGRAPDRLVAARRVGDRETLTRTLCPMPLAARYDGRGASADASSYACTPDTVLRDRLFQLPIGDRP